MFEDEPHAEGAAAVAAAREALQALCQELNLDEGSAAEALDDFTAIRGNYSLEVSGGRWAAAPTLARPPSPSFALKIRYSVYSLYCLFMFFFKAS